MFLCSALTLSGEMSVFFLFPVCISALLLDFDRTFSLFHICFFHIFLFLVSFFFHIFLFTRIAFFSFLHPFFPSHIFIFIFIISNFLVRFLSRLKIILSCYFLPFRSLFSSIYAFVLLCLGSCSHYLSFSSPQSTLLFPTVYAIVPHCLRCCSPPSTLLFPIV
jgi:hypothetical protein